MLSLKKEFYKLRHKKKYTVLLILGLLFLVGRYGLGELFTRLIGSGTVSFNTNMTMEILPALAEILVPVVIFLAAADLFSAQQQEDTLKADFLRPVTRASLLISKVGAILIMGVIYFAVFFIACIAAQTIMGGSIRFVLKSAAAYAVDIIPLINIALFAVLINMLVPTPALSVVLCIAIYALLKYLSIYNGTIGPMLFTSYSRWHNLIIGSVLPFGALLGKMGIIFGTMLIFASVSYIIIDRKSF